MLKRTPTILLLLSATTFGQSGATVPAVSDNADLTQMFKEDQGIRQPAPTGQDVPKITPTDADRLLAVKEMLAHDQIHTKADYFHAALILQHSHESSDYLVAHTLVVLCAAEQDKTCLWLSAATLDRYLQSINQPQIYGTQFRNFDKPPITQEPYASTVISDALRKTIGVPPLEQQQHEVEKMNRQNLPCGKN